MTKPIRIELTRPQVEALLGAIAEVSAGDWSHWTAPEWRALQNAREKLLMASP